MPRDLDALAASDLDADALRPVLFFEVGTTDDAVFVRAWSGTGTFSWDSKEWIGLGDLAQISAISEVSSGVRAPGVTYRLSGIASALIPESLSVMRQGRPCRLWIGVVDSTLALKWTPAMLSGGRVDQVEATDDGTAAYITLSSVGWLTDFTRSRVRRYTSEDQKIVDIDDRGFEYVAYLQDAQILWGRSG